MDTNTFWQECLTTILKSTLKILLIAVNMEWVPGTFSGACLFLGWSARTSNISSVSLKLCKRKGDYHTTPHRVDEAQSETQEARTNNGSQLFRGTGDYGLVWVLIFRRWASLEIARFVYRRTSAQTWRVLIISLWLKILFRAEGLSFCLLVGQSIFPCLKFPDIDLPKRR